VDVAVTEAKTDAGRDVVLCVNAGSSSLKLALFATAAGEPRALGRASVDRVTDHGRALDDALGQLAGQPAPTLASHRIVHGGAEHTAPAWIDARLIAGLEALIPLAPLHLPPSIAAIAAVTARRPGLRQVACFDTAFHAQLPEVARRLPLPAAFDRAGIRRYGFHGLSYEYIVSALGPALPPRLVIAHLGNGASLAAVEHGRSIDTTMGLTPTGGIPMGTRTGDLDPGVVLYLARERGMAPDAIAELVEHHGGLAGVGGAADMRTLLARAPDDPAARLAVELFGYAVRKQIGAYAAALGGLDALVFTGGIGEHAPEVRALACRGLAFAGVVLDDARNRASAPDIGVGACAVRVIPTDEDAMLARHAVALAAR
jgi:acetate kinase